jgi:hypothetical protein
MISNKQRTIALSTVAIAAVTALFATGPLVATHQAQAQICVGRNGERFNGACPPLPSIPIELCVVCAIIAGHQGHQVQASHSTGQIGIPHGR